MPKRRQPASLRLLILLLVLGAVFLLVGSRGGASLPPAPPVGYRVVAGDTLWAIASRLAGADGDVRVQVELIRDLNDLATVQVEPGQTLLLPVPTQAVP